MSKWKKRKKLLGYRNWTHWKDSKKDDPANPGLSRQWLVKTVFNKHCTCFRMRAGGTQSGRLGQTRSVPVVSLVGACYQRKKGMQADLPGFLFVPTSPDEGTCSPVTPTGRTPTSLVLDGTFASMRGVRSNCDSPVPGYISHKDGQEWYQ